MLWVAGFFAITGAPPFGSFLSEFTILKAALDQGRTVVAVAYLALLSVIFVGMASAVLGMAQGPAPAGHARARGERLLAIAPAGALAALVLLLGVYIPPVVRSAVEEAARALG
jgi:hydrogenase-4 component F